MNDFQGIWSLTPIGLLSDPPDTETFIVTGIDAASVDGGGRLGRVEVAGNYSLSVSWEAWAAHPVTGVETPLPSPDREGFATAIEAVRAITAARVATTTSPDPETP